jgi:hypothetical protein
VPSGERRSVDRLDGITTFIARFLEQMGVKASRPSRRRWAINRRKRT